MVRDGTVWYGSLMGGFPLGTVPGTFLVPPRPGFQESRTVTITSILIVLSFAVKNNHMPRMKNTIPSPFFVVSLFVARSR